MPEDGEEFAREAKEQKWVPYDNLAEIPALIRAERMKIAQDPTQRKKLALLARDELLLAWMTTLPWRQRNLRECKLGRKEEGANLFKDKIPSSSTIATPSWVKEALRTDGRTQFWQIFFRSEETKTSQTVYSFLPKQLIPLLEEYLTYWRLMLLSGSDPARSS